MDLVQRLMFARRFALEALLARLPLAPVEKREPLRQRIAGIRAGIMDSAPEVGSALIAVTHFDCLLDVEQTVTDSSAVEAETVCGGAEVTNRDGEKRGASDG